MKWVFGVTVGQYRPEPVYKVAFVPVVFLGKIFRLVYFGCLVKNNCKKGRKVA